MANKAKHFWIEPDDLARKGFDFCSFLAQAIWFKVIRLAHDSERYGYLSRDGKAVTDEQLARRCGVDVQALLPLLGELTDFDLLKRTADGILFSPELVAQAEWRSKEAKRQKDFQDKKRQKSNVSNNAPTNGSTNGSYNGYITDDLTPESRPNFKQPVSFSDEKKTGRSQRAGARDDLPAAAVVSKSKGKSWQWLDLTPAEDQMSVDDFLIHLQKENPEKDVQAIFKKVKTFCVQNKKDFAKERIKGWVHGEAKTISLEGEPAEEMVIPNIGKLK